MKRIKAAKKVDRIAAPDSKLLDEFISGNNIVTMAS
jgi:hypothetical protein